MVEILWKSDPSQRMLPEREFFELHSIDLGANATPRFVVRQIHGVWSGPELGIKWNGYQDESCSTPEKAIQQYAARRAALVEKGFSRSNLEFRTAS